MDDVLIVGSGVIGLSLAYELAGHGLSVHVIDQGQPGREASWAGAGILPPGSREPQADPYSELAGLSCELHAQWARQLQDETGIDNGYRPCGGAYLATEPADAAALQHEADTWQQGGIDAIPLSRDELAGLEPALANGMAKSESLVAFHLPGEAQLRNPRHLKALLAACQQRGVTISAECEALQIIRDGRRVSGVETPRGTLRAGQFAITCGAWTGPLARQLGVNVAVRPIRGQMVLLSTEVLVSRVINIGPRYLVPRFDGRILVGSTEEDVGFEKQTTPDGINGLRELAAQLAPELATASTEKSWAGLRPASSDGLPWIGRAPELENVVLAAGHFRAGLQLSTGTAVVTSQLLRGERTQIDLTPFRLDRELAQPAC